MTACLASRHARHIVRESDFWIEVDLGIRDFFLRRFPVERREPRVEFLGEQDGQSERELKELLAAEFARRSTVERAYLARLGFAPDAPPSVGLCLVSTSRDDIELVTACAKIFRDLFNSAMALDIVFISAEQEADLARVCAAFYPPRVVS